MDNPRIESQDILKVGSLVTYHGAINKEIGVVKEIPIHTKTQVRVVYNCAGDWSNFKKYTSCITFLSDLSHDWEDDWEKDNII
tara:strand:- start:71 stop:319 length:249 start_codon:yes stop_codon:yes gene_type:complete